MINKTKAYRERVDKAINTRIWWSLWLGGMAYFLYMLFFNVALIHKINYGLPGNIAVADIYIGNLFFFAVNIPLMSFTCLFTGHMALGLYKANKLKR